MQKKQKYSFTLSNNIFTKSLIAFFAIGLFAVNISAQEYTNKIDKNLLLKPYKKLNDEQYDKFILGRSFFSIPWVEAPSATTARDGLGPLFSANTCKSCHPNNGRGNLYNKTGNLSRALVVRLSIKDDNSLESQSLKEKLGFIPEPNYGAQISINGLNDVPFEAIPTIKFKEKKVTFPDGQNVILLKPKYELKNLNYGKLHKDSVISYRIANSLHGLGMISQISDEEILKNADENDVNGDGISGRANIVYSKISKKEELGRYTWKASSSSIIEQIANAAHNDMGLTTPYIKEENCTKNQKKCLEAPIAKDDIDITLNRLEAMDFYIKNLKVYTAEKTKEYKQGLKLFNEISCSKCHINNLKTKDGKEVLAFSDFLLHDMGEGLADGRVEFKAKESEFRTAPLWGLALHKLINKKEPRLLHDGRARSFEEAILWHGGEANASKLAYMNLEKEQRKKLIEFLEGL